ncbi:MAG: alkaline phosphatase family protein [Chloroflexota bacterium]
MASKPKRVAVVGLDCAMPHLIKQQIAAGGLPTLKKLIDGGALAENCLPPFPTITPPNWATIATGACAGTHQVTDFWIPIKGTTPINANTVASYNSANIKAEFVWEAAAKAGKKAIVFNYPGAWPARVEENLIVIAGAGLGPGEHRDGYNGNDHDMSLCSNQLITNGVYPEAIRSEFEPAEGWANLDEPGEEPLEMAAKLIFPRSAVSPVPTTWWVLARQSEGETYDTVSLSPSKDVKDAFFTLHPGEWSPKVTTQIQLEDGSSREVFFKAKLVELSEDAEDFRLYLTGLMDLSRWVSDPAVLPLITASQAVPVPEVAIIDYGTGKVDLTTMTECAEIHTEWLADAAVALMGSNEWDLFCMHSHPIDWSYHAFFNEMDPHFTPDEAKRAAAWEAHRRVYEAQDKLLARVLEAIGRDGLLMVVSDHGASPDSTPFNPIEALANKGLAQLKPLSFDPSVPPKDFGELVARQVETMNAVVPAESQALAQRMLYVYVNLKGRDPEGVVEPEDYDKVVQQICDAMLTYVHPKTGTRPVALAIPKADARLLGLYGENVGDVIYAIYPNFGFQHGGVLPTASWGPGNLNSLFLMYGPGVKKGLKIERTVYLTDVVPTLCYAADLPVPEQAEGAIIFQAFKDHDYKRTELAKLQGGLERMQAAMARKTRQPWDKHDCA